VSSALPGTDQLHSGTEAGYPDRGQRGESLASTGRLPDRPDSTARVPEIAVAVDPG
jgi:hypothetical protein